MVVHQMDLLILLVRVSSWVVTAAHRREMHIVRGVGWGGVGDFLDYLVLQPWIEMWLKYLQ